MSFEVLKGKSKDILRLKNFSSDYYTEESVLEIILDKMKCRCVEYVNKECDRFSRYELAEEVNINEFKCGFRRELWNELKRRYVVLASDLDYGTTEGADSPYIEYIIQHEEKLARIEQEKKDRERATLYAKYTVLSDINDSLPTIKCKL